MLFIRKRKHIDVFVEDKNRNYLNIFCSICTHNNTNSKDFNLNSLCEGNLFEYQYKEKTVQGQKKYLKAYKKIKIVI